MSKADEEVLEELQKIKEYCEQNSCEKCIFNDGDRKCFLKNIPQNWELDEIKKGQDIDIQAIEEIPKINVYSLSDFDEDRDAINELIRAVKQLDRKIREER